jgi:ribonuclease E
MTNSNNIMLIDAQDATEMRVVVLQNGEIEHFDFVSKSKQQIKGNIYLGKITRIEPSLQAAFVEYGAEKQGFLSFSEIHPDYYQIPVEDKQRLLEEAANLADDGEDFTSNTESDNSVSANDEPKQAVAKIKKRGGRRKKLNKRGEVEVNSVQNDDVIQSDNIIETSEIAAEVAPQKIENAAEVINNNDINDDADNNSDDGKTIPMSVSSSDEVIIAEQSLPLESSEEIIESEDDVVVETGNKDEAEEIRHTNFALLRRYKIQEVIKPGQLVLVQVIKEERGNKGVSLSTYMSLAGRYCVVMPNSPKGGGISRKIGSGDDRKRLKEISDELKELRGMSAIIRTAGLDRSKTEIKRDYEYLIKLWNQVREDAISSIAPSLVYEENDIIKRSIRDHYDSETGSILVQGEAAYKKAKEFMKLLMPSHAAKIKQHKDNAPIFSEYSVEGQINDLYRSTVQLKSGGYLVINPTEALISVDVNSGRSTNEKNVEETAYKTNLEACAELARQLRLRNLGGLIVVDFIDMSYHKYRRNVEKALKEALKDDRAKIQIGHISSFGLLELSRQRIGSSLEESTTQTCSHCTGTGRVMRSDVAAIQLLRNLRYFLNEHVESGEQVINIAASQDVLVELLSNHRAALDIIAKDFGVSFAFELHPDDRDISYIFRAKAGVRFDSSNLQIRNVKPNAHKNKKKNKRKDLPNADESSVKIEEKIAEEVIENSEADGVESVASENVVKKSRRRGRRGGKNLKNRDKLLANNEETVDENIDESDIIAVEVIETQVAETQEMVEVAAQNEVATENADADIEAPPINEEQPSGANARKRKGWWQRVLDV